MFDWKTPRIFHPPEAVPSGVTSHAIVAHVAQFCARFVSHPSIPTPPRPRNPEAKNHHSMTAAPQVKPAPKTTKSTRSPGLMRPAPTASSSAIATLAALVLPYRSTFEKT